MSSVRDLSGAQGGESRADILSSAKRSGLTGNLQLCGEACGFLSQRRFDVGRLSEVASAAFFGLFRASITEDYGGRFDIGFTFICWFLNGGLSAGLVLGTA